MLVTSPGSPVQTLFSGSSDELTLLRGVRLLGCAFGIGWEKLYFDALHSEEEQPPHTDRKEHEDKGNGYQLLQRYQLAHKMIGDEEGFERAESNHGKAED